MIPNPHTEIPAARPRCSTLELEQLVKRYQRAEGEDIEVALTALSEACEPVLDALGARYGAEQDAVSAVLIETLEHYRGGVGHLFWPALQRHAREALAKRALSG